MSFRRIDVAVIGGGVAGCAATAALAASARAGFSVALFDRAEPGPGTAYAPQSPSLLMNGPVRAMSPIPGDRSHLSRYLVDEADDALICRARYGAYMRATISATLAARRDFASVRGDVVDIDGSESAYRIRLSDGRCYDASNVVLALGNLAPNQTFLPELLHQHKNYHRDPWRADISAIDAGDVALLGSRLTAMDVIALLDEQAFRGRIHVISRHGLLPHVENPRARGVDPARLHLDTSSPYRLLQTMRRAARSHPGDWREIVESIRDITPAIWASWSARDKRRFLRHAQSMWAIHRYRVPAATHAAFLRFNAAGRILIHRAHVAGAAINDESIELRLRNADRTYDIRVAHVVNCTGPESNVERADDALVKALLRRGLIRADALHLGIETDAPSIFALGPLLRGRDFESTAVPEIARQAGIIAEMILSQTTGEAKYAG